MAFIYDYVITTPGVDIDAKATAFDAELNITDAEVIGHADEDGLTNGPAAATGSDNTVLIRVTGVAAVDITNAATAVGDVTLREIVDAT